MTEGLQEGWYLMSVADLEIELGAWRDPQRSRSGSSAKALTIEEAIAYRDDGNIPDEHGRTLRLVLHVRDGSDLQGLDGKRAFFEPDYLDAPTWRREGSRPINVVPLRPTRVSGSGIEQWIDDPAIAALEEEWQKNGTISGVIVPGDYRSFVFKTVLALQQAGKEVTARSIADAVSRWLPDSDAQRVREALRDA